MNFMQGQNPWGNRGQGGPGGMPGGPGARGPGGPGGTRGFGPGGELGAAMNPYGNQPGTAQRNFQWPGASGDYSAFNNQQPGSYSRTQGGPQGNVPGFNPGAFGQGTGAFNPGMSGTGGPRGAGGGPG